MSNIFNIMATPITRSLSSGENTSNVTSCGDCLVGYCCCLQSPYCIPSSVTLNESMFMTQPNSFNQEHHASYEYKEPEENFVSIDDIKIKKFLTKIGQQKQTLHEHSVEQKQCKKYKSTKKTTIFSIENENSIRPVVYEIIELDDEEERKKLKRIKLQAEKDNSKKIPDSNYDVRQSKRLDISLIPKYSHNDKHVQDYSTSKNLMSSSNPTIVAEIDLVDSSSSDSSLINTDKDYVLDKFHQDDEESFPLVASVQCELLYDDNNSESHRNRTISKKGTYLKKCGKRELLKSDYVTKFQQDTLPTCWDEYSGRRERVLFECFLCGKKVQSSYNLRRHMMIHTGEKPFNCDLCNRQFREFSDLKKHRRRHAGEVKFLCMVCGKLPPADTDPTRCVNCCAQTKSSVIVAASASRPSFSSAITISRQDENFTEVTCKNEKNTPTSQACSKFSELGSANIIKSNIVIRQDKRISELSSSQRNASQAPQRMQNLLNNLPAVHRPDYNQLGTTTRKEFPCPLCSRAFGSRHNLKRHYMIHTGEKPFSCTECRKPFREYSTLKKHMITHQRDRWYKCVRCSQKFRDFLQYCEHKNLHPTSIKDTFEISTSKRCRSLSHSKCDDSSSDDWLECFECAQTFTNVERYNNHIKQHDLNVRSYECYICNTQFNDECDLQIHKELHSDEQGFS